MKHDDIAARRARVARTYGEGRHRSRPAAPGHGDAQLALLSAQFTTASAALAELAKAGFVPQQVLLGNGVPVIAIAWCPGCDDLLAAGRAVWSRMCRAGRDTVYTYAWPFMGCRVQWSARVTEQPT